MMTFKYKKSCVGGTFDHLHLGHKELLNFAFVSSEKVLIGLATEGLYSKKFLASSIEEYSVREDGVRGFLKEKGYEDRAEIVPLNDIYGQTLEDRDLEAIFVTEATLGNAKFINERRVEKGFSSFEIVVVPFKMDEEGDVIASERIRLGEIDRNGHVYMGLFRGKSQLRLPEDLREKMRLPIGDVIRDLGEEKGKGFFVVSVGDVVSKSLRALGCVPDVEIIDFRNKRNVIDEKAFAEYKGKMYKNDAGTIERGVVDVYRELMKRSITSREKQVLVIDGEEDLLTLAAILLGPLGAVVYYGQFDLNAVVRVEITEEKKSEVENILRGFE